jgi:hypothetical protein
MCFSAQASFATGVVISSIGVAALKRVNKPSQKTFAAIPLFFGVQQVAEGFLWLTIPLPGYLAVQKVSAYFFLVMALVIWPSMIPLSATRMEEDPRRKRQLKMLLGLGLALSSYYAFCLIFFRVNPQVDCYHILYQTDFPKALSLPAFLLYLTVTITPFYLSGIHGTRLFATLMLIACLITVAFYRLYLTSIWCFFAALLSAIIYWIIRESEKESQPAAFYIVQRSPK